MPSTFADKGVADWELVYEHRVADARGVPGWHEIAEAPIQRGRFALDSEGYVYRPYQGEIYWGTQSRADFTERGRPLYFLATVNGPEFYVRPFGSRRLSEILGPTEEAPEVEIKRVSRLKRRSS